MKLIADSGSSKTTWALLHPTEVRQFSSRGLNPYFFTADEVTQILKDELPADIPFNTVEEIHFFGSGCSAPDRNQIIIAGLAPVFPNAKVWVEHDMYGAALALCKSEPGIACILGTGSNSCYFDGTHITQSVAAPGFILADEGGGSYLGKQLIRDYIRKDMPAELIAAMDETYRYTEPELIKKIYSEKNPNRFLASFTHFIFTHLQNSYCQNLVRQSFEDFYRSNICKYAMHTQIPIHCIGSVGYFFKPILAEVLKSHGAHLGLVIQEPMPELIQFFKHN